jgi:predicted TPR repeat methyltransferase
MNARLLHKWFRQAKDHHQAGDLPAALVLYKQILRKDPHHVAAMYGAGLLAWQIGELDTALRLMRQVVARRPDYADGHYNLAVVYETLGQWFQALASYQEAILRRPTFADAWEGLAKTLHAMGHRAEAVAYFERAIALRPPGSALTAESRYNMSYSLLSLGRYREGWAAYESRFESPVFTGTYLRRHHQPVWDGSPLEGRRLLVHAEQGFGDSLMMARYLAQVPAGTIVEVQAPLERLFAASFPHCIVIPQAAPLPHPCDCQLAMMSLAHRFGMDEQTVPGAPYLSAPAGLVLPAGDGCKIGFAWAGSSNHKNDRFRSIALEHWQSLWSLPGVTWYSLQVDLEPVNVPCHNLRPLIRDFADTAALVAQLDLVIACDTAIVHLAGALGRPVWVLLPAVPDYRWGLERSDSPWYPSARLIRQETAGDWPGVMQRVREQLLRVHAEEPVPVP